MVKSNGSTVYVYGESVATVVQADDSGAIVREHDDNGETWFPWSDLPGVSLVKRVSLVKVPRPRISYVHPNR